ncbi:MAG: hypothetical protein RIG61_05625 [Deltaproteobacteria bacterium]
MKTEEIFEEIKEYLSGSGFNLVVKIQSSEYDKISSPKKESGLLLKGAKSIILAGFGGSYFWGTFRSFLEENPDFREKHEDLIDNYTVLQFEHVSRMLSREKNLDFKTVFPFGSEALDLDFVKLGKLGGIGVPSLLGMLLHPEYGTWISLRGAILTNMEFGCYDTELSSFDPCPSCPKPCITACPARTISQNGWDWEACMRFRLDTDVCSANCASRLACPYGDKQRYTDEQILYHHGFVIKSVKRYYSGKG